MATWDDVRLIAERLPEVTESGGQWRVRRQAFVWERPLRKADLAILGESAPDGPILGAYVADEGVKQALLSEDPQVFFTTPHFDGYAVVLARLERISLPDLEELVVESWLLRAPKRLAGRFLAAESQ